MVKIQLISYANKKALKQQRRLNKSATKYGITNIISYNEDDLKRTKFYDKYKQTLDASRGAGYWLWKPFFIYKTLSKLNEEDILIYSDADLIFINSPLPLIKIAKEEKILLFGNNEFNVKWNKYRCLVGMCCNTQKYIDKNAKQVSAGFQLYINNERTRSFVKEWLSYCCKFNLINDTNNHNEGYISFRGHKHDQAILSNLAIKYNIPLYRDPSQYGNHLKPKEFRVWGEWLSYPYRYKEAKAKTEVKTNIERFKYPTIINNPKGNGKIKLFLIKLHTKIPRWIRRKLIRK